MRHAAIVFDAYGTLYDVHSVIALAESFWPGRGAQLSQLWRAKQLEYTWLRSLMGRYEDFGRVTDDALRHACATLGLPLDDAKREGLMDAYLRLAPFAEVPDTLARLGGARLAILSNGSPAMLEPLVAHSGLGQLIGDVISVDVMRMYKPAPRVYQLAAVRLGVPAASIAFVSSNCWDAIGAQSFGFTSFWVNRAGAQVDALGVAPARQLRTLSELPAALDA